MIEKKKIILVLLDKPTILVPLSYHLYDKIFSISKHYGIKGPYSGELE